MKLCLINKLQKFNSNSGAQLLEYPGIRIRRLLRTCKNKNIHYYINSRPKPPFNIITEPRTPLPVVWSPMEKKKTGNLWCDCNGGSRPSAKWGQAVSKTIFQVGLKISGSAGAPRWIRHWFGSEVIVTWPSTTTSPSEFVVIYLNDSHIIVNWKLSESGNRSEKKRHWIEVSNYQYLKNDFSANSTKTDKNEWNDLWQKSDRNAPLALSVFKANGIMPLMTGHQ